MVVDDSESTGRSSLAAPAEASRDDAPASEAEPTAVAPEAPVADDRLAQADILTEEAWQLIDQGRLREALHAAQHAMAMVQEVPGPADERLITLLDLAAMLHEDLRDDPAAIASREKMFEAQAAKWPAGHWRVRDAKVALENLRARTKLNDNQRVLLGQAAATVQAASQASPEQYQEAVAVVQQAIGVQIDLLGERHRDVANSLTLFGALLSRGGAFADAEQCHRQAVAIRTDVLGEMHPAVGDALHNLGLLLCEGAQYEPALQCLEQALRVAEAAYGPQHIATATVHSNLGGLFGDTGRLNEARTHYERALEIHRLVFGERHPRTANALTNLGVVLQQQQRLTEARRHHEEALAIFREVHDEPHPDAAQALNNLATVAAALGDAGTVRQCYHDALSILLATLGERHVETARVRMNHAAELLRTGELREARAAFEQALETLLELLDESHPFIAESRTGLGRVLTELGEYPEARTHLDQALSVHRDVSGESSAPTARTRYQLGFLLIKLGDFQAAREQLEAALRIQEEVLVASHPDVADTLDALGQAWLMIGDTGAALEHFERALGVLEGAGGHEVAVALVRNNRAVARHRSGDFLAALAEYEEVLGVFRRRLGRHADTATAINNMADLSRLLGEYDRAYWLHHEALAMRRKLFGEQHVEIAMSLNNLGLLAGQMGDVVAARKYLELALSVCERTVGDDHVFTGTTLSNLCTVFTSMNDHTLARRFGARAVRVLHAAVGERHLETAAAQGNLGRALLNSDTPSDARPHLERAAETIRAVLGDQHPDYGAALLVVGYLCELEGDAKTAAEQYAQAYHIYHRGFDGLHANAALCLDALGTLYLAHGQYTEAAAYFERSLQIRRQLLRETHPDIAASYHLMGTAHYWQGNAVEAEQWVRQSLELSRQHLDLLSFAQSERQQLKMLRAMRHRLNDYLSLAIQTGESPAAVYDDVLAWKGSVFRQQQMRGVAGDAESAALMAQLRSTASRLAALAFMSPPADQRNVWLDQLERLTDQREQMETRLADQSREFRQMRPVATAAQLAALLPADTALVDVVEFAFSPLPSAEQSAALRLGWRLAAFIVRRDRPVALVDLGAADPVADAVERWRRDCQGGLSAAEHAEELHRLVWVPLQRHIGDASTVLISPDGALTRFPFAALPGNEPGSYLIEDLSLAALPAPADLPRWMMRRRDGDKEPSLLLVGDVDFDAAPDRADPAADPSSPTPPRRFAFAPLPGAAKEVAEVESLFRRRMPDRAADTLRGAAATKRAFTEAAPQRTIVHAATHGFFFAEHQAPFTRHSRDRGATPALEHPLDETGWEIHPGVLSGIALAGANRAGESAGDDAGDVLTALEIAALDLRNVDLLVLSACDTGLGELMRGEGALGLQRACQIAGVRATVTSLWKVEDEATRQLMTRFYHNLWEKKLQPLAALREAQLWLMKTGDQGAVLQGRRPPRCWAAFVLSGV